MIALSGLSQDFLRTFAGLSQDFLRAFSGLSPDFLRISQEYLRTFSELLRNFSGLFRTFSGHWSMALIFFTGLKIIPIEDGSIWPTLWLLVGKLLSGWGWKTVDCFSGDLCLNRCPHCRFHRSHGFSIKVPRNYQNFEFWSHFIIFFRLTIKLYASSFQLKMPLELIFEDGKCAK